jgi:hypothetical protein
MADSTGKRDPRGSFGGAEEAARLRRLIEELTAQLDSHGTMVRGNQQQEENEDDPAYD